MALILSILLVTCILAAKTVYGRTFSSPDPDIRRIIAQCVDTVNSNPTPPSQTTCQATLNCILNSADNYITGRWSAGASILAFIPTITGLMGNSIDEIVIVAEQSIPLAILLSLSSVTAFTSRFGSISGTGNRAMSSPHIDEFVQNLRRELEQKSIEDPDPTKSRWWPRILQFALRVAATILLLAGCAGIWRTVKLLFQYGVVINSCPSRLHVPLWVGLTQATAVLNVILKRWSYKTKHIPMLASASLQSIQPKQDGTSSPSSSPASLTPAQVAAAAAVKQQPTLTLALRAPRKGWAAYVIRGSTSVLSFALYAFGTALLGSMTMIPASDAIRDMAVFSASAGLSRIIASLAMASNSVSNTVTVADIPEQYWPRVQAALDLL